MRDRVQGRPFHGEFSTADASGLSEANSRFNLYKPGSTTALTLAANERVVVTSVVVAFTGATSRAVQVYDGADATVDAGELLFQSQTVQNVTTVATFPV